MGRNNADFSHGIAPNMSDVGTALGHGKITLDEAKDLVGKKSDEWPVEHMVATPDAKSHYEHSTHHRAGLNWKNDGN